MIPPAGGKSEPWPQIGNSDNDPIICVQEACSFTGNKKSESHEASLFLLRFSFSPRVHAWFKGRTELLRSVAATAQIWCLSPGTSKATPRPAPNRCTCPGNIRQQVRKQRGPALESSTFRWGKSTPRMWKYSCDSALPGDTEKHNYHFAVGNALLSHGR